MLKLIKKKTVRILELSKISLLKRQY